MYRSEVARSVGCSPETLLHYEKLGLLPEPGRSDAGYREYDQEHVDIAHFIRHARELGFDLKAIAELLDLGQKKHSSCETVDKLARHQLMETRSKIQQLKSLEKSLQSMIEKCAGGIIENCRILDTLRGHAVDNASPTLVDSMTKGQTPRPC